MSVVDGMALGGDTITIRRAGASTSEDAYGNPVAVPVEFQIPGCSLQPMIARNVTSETQTPTQDLVVSRYHLFAPYGSDIRAADVILFAGNVYDVQGKLTFWEPDEYGDGHGETYLEIREG